MNLVETINQPSQNIISTLSGQIQIDEGRGVMKIYDPILQADLVTIDRTGFLFNDGNTRRIKLGSFATKVGLYIVPYGRDVINELSA